MNPFYKYTGQSCCLHQLQSWATGRTLLPNWTFHLACIFTVALHNLQNQHPIFPLM